MLTLIIQLELFFLEFEQVLFQLRADSVKRSNLCSDFRNLAVHQGLSVWVR